MKPVIVLGVDPGFSVTGYSLVAHHLGKTQIIDCGYLALKSTDSLSCRTGQFYNHFQKKIIDAGVTRISLETSFLGKNAQTFLKLGFLRGVLYLLADQHSLELCEFAPTSVKMSVTGSGGASKDQVALMLSRIFPQLNLLKQSVRSDVTDALAIGLCGLWHSEQQNLAARIKKL